MKKLPWILLAIAVVFILFLLFSPKFLIVTPSRALGFLNKGIPMEFRYIGLKQANADLVLLTRNKQYVSALLAGASTNPISLSHAQTYANEYKTRMDYLRSTLQTGNPIREDSSRAIIFQLDSIVPKMIEAFRLDPNKITLADFKDKALLLYLANYGMDPRKSLHQTSLILQFGKKATSQDPYYTAVENYYYNFGDLKPPDTIRNDSIIGQ